MREFLLEEKDLTGFLERNEKKLIPGESIMLVCERALVHELGLGLRVRVMIDGSKLAGEAAEYFFTYMGEDFPWALFQNPKVLPVVFCEENLAVGGELCAVYRPALIMTEDFGDGITYDTVKRLEGFYARIPDTMIAEGK